MPGSKCIEEGGFTRSVRPHQHYQPGSVRHALYGQIGKTLEAFDSGTLESHISISPYLWRSCSASLAGTSEMQASKLSALRSFGLSLPFMRPLVPHTTQPLPFLHVEAEGLADKLAHGSALFLHQLPDLLGHLRGQREGDDFRLPRCGHSLFLSLIVILCHTLTMNEPVCRCQGCSVRDRLRLGHHVKVDIGSPIGGGGSSFPCNVRTSCWYGASADESSDRSE